jgi:chemotaxis protein MotB
VKNPSVIVVKKVKKGGHGGHHGGAWKVAYADFVTAMMAFFLVMWIVAQSNAVKAAIGGYFREPGVFDFEKSNGMVPGGDQAPLNPDQPPSPAPPRPDGQVSAEQARQAMERMAGRLRAVLENLPDFKSLSKQIEMQITAEGLRIELLERADATFFDPGSASLKGGTVRILEAIAAELGTLPNDVMLEGHTDSTPYASRDGYSNWELSADRANAARRIMERGGLHERQVKAVRGFADTRLRLPDAPNDSRNRRVSIVVATLAPAPAAEAATRTGAHGGEPPSPAAPATAGEAHEQAAPAHVEAPARGGH